MCQSQVRVNFVVPSGVGRNSGMVRSDFGNGGRGVSGEHKPLRLSEVGNHRGIAKIVESSAVSAENDRSTEFLPKHWQVYDTLKEELITGRIVPGRGVTLRGLASSLGVSPMPVREAIRRIAAEGGLVVGANRRVYVPAMTTERFDELVRVRSILEPEIAALALPFIDSLRIGRLRKTDDAIETALKLGDAERYMQENFRFHFEIYTAAPSEVLMPMIESLWLRFGPFMRSVYGLMGTANLVDQHQRAIHAIESGNETELRAAIRADILDGMNMIGSVVLGNK